MVELKVRLGPKGQIVIPKILRDYYKIYPKEEILITAENEGIIIKKSIEDPILILEKIANVASEKRKGKAINYNKKEFYEQHEKRTKRAGL